MGTPEQHDSSPRVPVSALVADLITGTAPLKVALDLWRSHHGLSYEKVSLLLDRKKGSVSAWSLRPGKLRVLERDIAELIGYKERPNGAA